MKRELTKGITGRSLFFDTWYPGDGKHTRKLPALPVEFITRFITPVLVYRFPPRDPDLQPNQFEESGENRFISPGFHGRSGYREKPPGFRVMTRNVKITQYKE